LENILSVQKSKETSNAIQQIKQQKEKIQEVREARKWKLPAFEGQKPICCKRICCCGSIEEGLLKECISIMNAKLSFFFFLMLQLIQKLKLPCDCHFKFLVTNQIHCYILVAPTGMDGYDCF
jgi:hypothetical protein